MKKDTISRGYRILPGSAVPEMGSSSYDHTSGREYVRKQLGEYSDPGAGNIKEIEGAKSVPPPAHDGDALAMSERHHLDTIKYDTAHAVDHIEDAAKHRKELRALKRRG